MPDDLPPAGPPSDPEVTSPGLMSPEYMIAVLTYEQQQLTRDRARKEAAWAGLLEALRGAATGRAGSAGWVVLAVAASLVLVSQCSDPRTVETATTAVLQYLDCPVCADCPSGPPMPPSSPAEVGPKDGGL